MVFHPRLVGGSIDSAFWQNYIQPLLAEGAPQHVLFDGSASWHPGALCAIESAWKSCAEEPPGYDLQVRSSLSHLAFLLSRHCPADRKPLPEKTLRAEERMKRMLRFIQEHYGEEIGSAAIAGSAAISESECLRCFRNTIDTPPIQYLKQFRVQRAAELLASTAWSTAEIGARCGFQDASYFTKTFRQLKGCTRLLPFADASLTSPLPVPAARPLTEAPAPLGSAEPPTRPHADSPETFFRPAGRPA